MDRDELLGIMREIIKRKAVNPAAGGNGELERANYLQEILESRFELKVRRYEVKDERGIVRPNLIAEIRGSSNQNVWILSHIDTVSEGDISLWKHPPFELTVEGNNVYGRGVSDNGIGIFSTLILLDKILKEEVDLKYNLKIAFLSDEEAGSKYGLKWLVENTEEFKKGDWAIVPDAGNKEGTFMEIAEKGILWLKFEVIGKQTHGSVPYRGLNANLHSMRFQTWLYDELHKRFPKKDPLFDPQESTFEPTKREKNVDSINIIPGKDISYWDCRVLPDYDLDGVLKFIEEKAKEYEGKTGAKINVEVIMREDSSKTDPNAEVVQGLKNSVKKVLRVEPKLYGIGGGTLAGILRKIGIESVVWSICSETEHQPDEYELIENYYKNADVFFDFLTS